MIEHRQHAPAISEGIAALAEHDPAVRGVVVVVLAMNAWMARAFPQFERSVAIVSSDMLITEPRPDLLDEIGLTSGVTVLDSRIFVHYYHNLSLIHI